MLLLPDATAVRRGPKTGSAIRGERRLPALAKPVLIGAGSYYRPGSSLLNYADSLLLTKMTEMLAWHISYNSRPSKREMSSSKRDNIFKQENAINY